MTIMRLNYCLCLPPLALATLLVTDAQVVKRSSGRLDRYGRGRRVADEPEVVCARTPSLHMAMHLPGLAVPSGRSFVKAVFKTRLALIAIASVLFVNWAVPTAKAHEAPNGWSYPFSCCSGFDCRSVHGASVKERPEGYVVPSGEVLAMTDKRIRYSPDGEFHLCTIGGTDTGRTICLFVPPRSF